MMRILKIFGMLCMLCLMAGVAFASDIPIGTDMPAYKSSDSHSLDDCTADFTVNSSALPYSNSTTLVGAGNDCARRRSADHTYQFNVSQPGYYTFSTCATTSGSDTRIYLLTECCAGTTIAEDNNSCGVNSLNAIISCQYLQIGTYYLLVEAQSPTTEGAYTLSISSCSAPCGYPNENDGMFTIGPDVYLWIQTVDSSDHNELLYNGPWHGNGCNPDYDAYGFSYYSWGNQDFSWNHTFPYRESAGRDSICIDFVRIHICAYDVDFDDCSVQHGGDSSSCELDQLYGDEALLGHLSGTSGHYRTTQFEVPNSCVYDGVVNVDINIDAINPGNCIYATTVNWSQFIVSFHVCNHAPFTPQGSVPECVDGNSDLCPLITGPNPVDADGDGVNYDFEWFVYSSDIDDYIPLDWFGECLPSSQTVVGETYRVRIIARDDHDLVSDALTLDFSPIAENCGNWPGDEYDMGDLSLCYPTMTNNPGHRLTNIAWLGDCVTPELIPNAIETDGCDDGIQYLNLPWTPCEYEQIAYWVTAGENYPAYLLTGGKLYLNGWKDGNLDGDFCDDYLCGESASEWIVQDLEVSPSNGGPGDGGDNGGWRLLTIHDPGVMEGQGSYDGVFRWRLTSQPIGRYGFGAVPFQSSCEGLDCGNFASDFLGEVEDYVLPDGQLPVELSSFTANAGDEEITLRWSTASEINNDHFEIIRDGVMVGRINSVGNSSSAQNYSFSDIHLENGRTYSYALVCVDLNGSRENMRTVSASPSFNNAQVTEYALYQNYPNPFNPSTEITYDLKAAGLVKLAIYDVLGREIKSLVNDQQTAGRHSILFDAKGLASGVYFYRLETNDFTDMKKMMLMK